MSDSECIVVLVKADWCGHCKEFKPIYEQANKEIGANSEYKNIKFISYDTQTKELINHHKDDKNGNYKDKSTKPTYPYANEIGEVEGYPTIFVIVEKNDDNEKKILKKAIENRGSNSKEFNEIIIKTIKNLESDGKRETVLVGGNINYELKYQKYKSKYLELKKLLNK